MSFNSDQNYIKKVEFHCVPRKIWSGRIAGKKPVLQNTGEEDEIKKTTKNKSVAGIEQATCTNLNNCHTNCTTHTLVKLWELYSIYLLLSV